MIETLTKLIFQVHFRIQSHSFSSILEDKNNHVFTIEFKTNLYRFKFTSINKIILCNEVNNTVILDFNKLHDYVLIIDENTRIL